MDDATRDTDDWVRRMNPSPGARTRLVCLPHAGGSAGFFRPVSRALAPDTEVLAIQYPGRQDRRAERCIEHLPELADAVTQALLPWADRPLALFGHSMGATLAFEVACRLEKAGIPPLALFISGRRAPSRTRHETVHLRDDAGVLAEIKELNGTGASLLDDDEIMRMALPALRADYKAAETYRFAGAPPVAAPVHAHVGDSDPKVSVDEAAAWQEHTTGNFTLQVHPGGHFYLIDQAPQLIAALSGVLSRAER
ncbi:thioesterase II family protein [Streptomyces angustmyceticus]|uniref:thioesterase II family protein n=1 Tax=Streptomyces angustmyceticus TaxID=285578 RepID=UPI0021B01557|nr:alpha/beta fold hydrolase [Streptomyces angustmyceticus]